MTTQSAENVSPCTHCPHSQNDLERQETVMTDSTAEILRLIRAAEVQAMYKAERADYLRRHGRKMLNGRKQ